MLANILLLNHPTALASSLFLRGARASSSGSSILADVRFLVNGEPLNISYCCQYVNNYLTLPREFVGKCVYIWVRKSYLVLVDDLVESVSGSLATLEVELCGTSIPVGDRLRLDGGMGENTTEDLHIVLSHDSLLGVTIGLSLGGLLRRHLHDYQLECIRKIPQGT